jgi:hypothetical protein
MYLKTFYSPGHALHNAMYMQLGVNHNIYTCIFSSNISMKKLLGIFSHILYNLCVNWYTWERAYCAPKRVMFLSF